MRVDFTNLGVEPPDKGKTERTVRSGSQGNAASVGTTNGTATDSRGAPDQTQLSFSQARVQLMEASVLSAPEVRQGKVMALQQSIAVGSYAIDPVNVAEAITSELSSPQVR
jgi:flagellar biosynthesis anti-sigma factor FlgM